MWDNTTMKSKKKEISQKLEKNLLNYARRIEEPKLVLPVKWT